MKKLSTTLLADIVQSKRKSLNMTQAQLSELTDINRAQLSRLEQEDYCPLIPQLEKLGDVLDFDINDVFVNTAASKLPSPSPLHIAVAGTGYVGLSISVLLAQHNIVTVVAIIPEKVDLINQRKSPIQDEYIEKYLKEKEDEISKLAYRDLVTGVYNRNFFEMEKEKLDVTEVYAVLSVSINHMVYFKSKYGIFFTENIFRKGVEVMQQCTKEDIKIFRVSENIFYYWIKKPVQLETYIQEMKEACRFHFPSVQFTITQLEKRISTS